MMAREEQAPDGAQFYDNPKVFARYEGHRRSPDNPNDLIEQPAFLEVMGAVNGLRVLDLGCGDAKLGQLLLERGCREYVGVEGSARMVAVARENLNHGQSKVHHAQIEDYSVWRGDFDLVVSRLAFHYVKDLLGALHAVRFCLSPGGRLVLTVEHPVLTSFEAPRDADGRRGAWVVDNYFVEGPRKVKWMGANVVKYHRTVETYVSCLRAAGLQLGALREPGPGTERFTGRDAEYRRRSRIPLFLLLEAYAV